MLSRADIVPYLVARGLVGPRAIVEGSVRVVDGSRRNRSFYVVGDHGPAYLVKQGRHGIAGLGTVSHEAAIYERLTQAGTAAVPRSFGFDPEHEILVIAWLTDARNVREHHASTGRLPVRVAAAMGQVLASIHGERLSGLGPARPEVLSLARPTLGMLHVLSAGNVELIRLVQHSPELSAGLDAAAEHWREETLVHGDPRWDNWLRLPR